MGRGRALLSSLVLLTALGICGGQTIDIWYGTSQRVGFLGWAQDDFNVLGHVEPVAGLQSLSYSLNGAAPQPLSWHGYRRLAREGDFNIDIPTQSLDKGTNSVELRATTASDTATARLTISRGSGTQTLPLTIDWGKVRDGQEVGQYVDGKWAVGALGLRVVESGYDRLFLIGNQQWQDYDARIAVRIEAIDANPPPQSGANGLGVVARFGGHVVGGFRNFPWAQPKWGYLPLGCIAWLRWTQGAAQPPALCYYPGDSDGQRCFDTYPVTLASWHTMRVQAQTLPDREGAGVSVYRFKIWPAASPEPPQWHWEVSQRSTHALRRGGLALIAHHVQATFGAISITALNDTPLRHPAALTNHTGAARGVQQVVGPVGLYFEDARGSRYDLQGRVIVRPTDETLGGRAQR